MLFRRFLIVVRVLASLVVVGRVAGPGLIGIGFWDGAVCDPSPQGVVRAIRAAVELVGIDHVALGSDYDGATTVTFDVSELPALTQALVDAGFSRSEIPQVMGGNLVRYLRENLNDRWRIGLRGRKRQASTCS
jgi:microsomal dipeptidase-like Zn-dependent dipeptidase